MKIALTILLVFLGVAVQAQNSVVKQANAIYLTNDFDVVKFKIVDNNTNHSVPWLEFGTQTNTIFELPASGILGVAYGGTGASSVSGVVSNLGLTTIVTNLAFTINTLYTNSFGRGIAVNANAILTEAGVAGSSGLSFVSVGLQTNTVTVITAIGGLVGNVTNNLNGFVPSSGVYYFTNASDGSGNSGTVSGGQILVP